MGLLNTGFTKNVCIVIPRGCVRVCKGCVCTMGVCACVKGGVHVQGVCVQGCVCARVCACARGVCVRTWLRCGSRSRDFIFRGRKLMSRVENSRTSGVTSYFAKGR